MQRAAELRQVPVIFAAVDASQRRHRKPYAADAQLLLCITFRYVMDGCEELGEEKQRLLQARYFRRGDRNAQGREWPFAYASPSGRRAGPRSYPRPAVHCRRPGPPLGSPKP